MHESEEASPPEGWAFGVKEVSTGCYRVTGIGPAGMSVERVGSDEEELLLAVIADAEELNRRRTLPLIEMGAGPEAAAGYSRDGLNLHGLPIREAALRSKYTGSAKLRPRCREALA